MTLTVAASLTGLWAAITQDKGDVGYAGRVLMPAEQRYAQKEMLAVAFDCERLQY